MQIKLNTLAVAALLAMAGGASQAAITNAGPNIGDSSVLFVAWDNAKTTSLVVDLGVNFTNFLNPNTFVNTTGSLAYNGSNVNATWTFGSDTRSVNGNGVAGDYAWSAEFNNFLSAIGGGAYQWGVVAADNVTGAVSANNVMPNKQVLSTGNPTQANISGLTSSAVPSLAASNFTNFVAAQGALGTHAAHEDGASISTAGGSYLGTVMKQNFAALPWSYLSDVGATTNLFVTNQLGNPTVYQLGATATGYGVVDTLLAQNAATFKFDGTTLTYNVSAVPEPSTIAMMLAGLGLVGAVARRRRSAR
jgi:hypothetical protein